VTRAYGHVI